MISRNASLVLVALLSASALAFGCNKLEKPGATERQKEISANEEAKAITSEAQEHYQGAHAVAEKTMSAARAEFETTRENYLHVRRIDLIDLDRRIADLESAPTPSTAKAADVRARLAAINVQRDAFGRHMAMLENTPAATWDASTKKLDQEWDALWRAVDAAG
jgi:hypothetical protein